MAFHARNRRSSRTTRESSRESVFGLAGWLFADLLLALSVVFLVAQDRPSQETDKDAKIAELQEIIKEKSSTIDELSGRVESLQEICDKNGCAKASGLSPGEQLVVMVPRGAARGMTVERMERALDAASLTLESSNGSPKTSWAELVNENRRIGFVLFFTTKGGGSSRAKEQAKKNLEVLVQAMANKGLVSPELQLQKTTDGKFRYDVFPNLAGKYDAKEVENDDLMIRAFLFTYTSPSSSTTTTTVED